MTTFEIYLKDLTPEAQKNYLEAAHMESAEDGNYDVFPIAEIELYDADDFEEIK